jgi:hypothetical protein
MQPQPWSLDLNGKEGAGWMAALFLSRLNSMTHHTISADLSVSDPSSADELQWKVVVSSVANFKKVDGA